MTCNGSGRRRSFDRRFALQPKVAETLLLFGESSADLLNRYDLQARVFVELCLGAYILTSPQEDELDLFARFAVCNRLGNVVGRCDGHTCHRRQLVIEIKTGSVSGRSDES